MRPGKTLVGGRHLAYLIGGPDVSAPTTSMTRGEAKRQGLQPPILLIPGLGTGGWVWGRQAPLLARLFRVIVFDPRGTGGSDPCEPGYTIADLASDAVGLLDALGVERAHLVGLSMGGFVAQTLAITRPERVGGLVLCSTSFGGRQSVRPDPSVWSEYIGLRSRPPEEAEALVLRYHFGPAFAQRQPRLAALAARTYLLRAEPMETVMAQAMASARFDEGDRVGAIRSPTLVAHGTEDLILPVENARLLASRIPGARLILYQGAGHAFVIEQAREFSRDVVRFLSEPRGTLAAPTKERP